MARDWNELFILNGAGGESGSSGGTGAEDPDAEPRGVASGGSGTACAGPARP
jgi:hypothetical protein